MIAPAVVLGMAAVGVYDVIERELRARGRR